MRVAGAGGDIGGEHENGVASAPIERLEDKTLPWGRLIRPGHVGTGDGEDATSDEHAVAEKSNCSGVARVGVEARRDVQGAPPR